MAFAVAENKEMTTEGIELPVLFAECSNTIHTTPEIDGLDSDKNFMLGRDGEHEYLR
jgi:hypothetical protein